MPKSKETISSGDDVSSDEQPKKRTKTAKKPPAKKQKKEKSESESEEEEEEKPKAAAATTSKASKTASKSKDSDSDEKVGDDGMYTLGKLRFVNVSDFKGKAYVNIREYYEKDGKTLPGKKGISLAADQWENLKKHMAKIDADLKKSK